jgi:cob(I)alamin adenosyltransferase
MLYTRKGDNGTTKTFGCSQRISKSSKTAEALGSLDEINSFLGLCKVASQKSGFGISGQSFESIVHTIQETLFIVQAELAGSPMTVSEEKVKEVEKWTDAIEQELPPIKTFFISGGTELAALFDVARTVSRRAERRVVDAIEEGTVKVGDWTKAYLNRLSSVLYALARMSNHLADIPEIPPNYNRSQ